jgi:hypothetical protein
MERWEYDSEVLYNNADMLRLLNARADAGWELVTLTPHKMVRSLLSWDVNTYQLLAVYKRRKP